MYNYVPSFVIAVAALLAIWTAGMLLGWVLNRRESRREGGTPEPFNWRLLVNPGLYYEWIARGGR